MRKKNKTGRTRLSDIKLYYKATVIKTVWYWHNDRNIDQWNKIARPDINHSRILYDPPPRILEINAKINKWDLIKIKSFCTTKENISKVKRQPSEWEKIIANEATDKQLTSKI